VTGQEIGTEQAVTRWQIFRRLLVFQCKLLIDAAKDLLLSPLALAAALVDILQPSPPSRMLFPALMKLGRRAEEAISLFGRPSTNDAWTVDRIVDGVESGIRRRYGNGGRDSEGRSMAGNRDDGRTEK
jgi:hypothetical protein